MSLLEGRRTKLETQSYPSAPEFIVSSSGSVIFKRLLPFSASPPFMVVPFASAIVSEKAVCYIVSFFRVMERISGITKKKEWDSWYRIFRAMNRMGGFEMEFFGGRPASKIFSFLDMRHRGADCRCLAYRRDVQTESRGRRLRPQSHHPSMRGFSTPVTFVFPSFLCLNDADSHNVLFRRL
jgi:hypothetical protein